MGISRSRMEWTRATIGMVGFAVLLMVLLLASVDPLPVALYYCTAVVALLAALFAWIHVEKH